MAGPTETLVQNLLITRAK